MTRHTKSSRCPVCGGAKEDRQGEGKRCWGRSGDGWTYCTREDFAGGISMHERSSTYAHKMNGHCNCGVEHAPTNGNGHHPVDKKKIRSHVYELVDADGKLQAKHIRMEYDDGSKGFFFDPKGLKAETLPLYGVPELLKTPKDSAVILTEGEKKCDALRKLGFAAVSTACGASVTPYKKSLQVLAGYKVYLWADNDEPGRSHMKNIASVLIEMGMKPLAITWDQAPKKGDAADFIEGGGTAKDVEALIINSKPFGFSEWDEPLPLEDSERPDFPVGALPTWFADWVREISEEMQTPVDLAAMLGLSVLACATAKKYKIHIRENWTEPLNLMVAVALPPGERKSAVFSEAMKPIIQYEREHSQEWKLQYQLRKVEYELAEKRLNAAMKEAEKVETPDMAKINALAATFAALKKPVMPRLFADDVTVEKLAEMLANHNGKIGIFSAEGGFFTTLEGRYSDGMASLDTVLKAHGGDPIRVDRLNRDGNMVNAPALTFGLAVQPGVLADLGKRKEFLSRGLIARFLYSVPKSKVGSRLITPAGMKIEVSSKFFTCVRLMLQKPEQVDESGEIVPAILEMSPEAIQLFMEYAEEIEERLHPDNDMTILGGWGNKLMGALARIAGILHLASHAMEHPALPIPPISKTAILGIMSIGDYLVAHVKAAFGIIGNYATEDAARILGWIRKNKCSTFTRRQVYRGMHSYIKAASKLVEPLQLLEDHGFINAVEREQRKRGRPSELFNVNPRILS